MPSLAHLDTKPMKAGKGNKVPLDMGMAGNGVRMHSVAGTAAGAVL